MTETCSNCGETVSDRFHRVMSDRNGRLHACPECGGRAGRHGTYNPSYDYIGSTGTGDFKA